MKRAGVFLLAVLAVGLVAADRVDHKVVVDGFKYRVTRRGNDVEVANKAMVVSFTLDERDRQRRAVSEATGCKISDEMVGQDARLRGRLICPSSATEDQPSKR